MLMSVDVRVGAAAERRRVLDEHVGPDTQLALLVLAQQPTRPRHDLAAKTKEKKKGGVRGGSWSGGGLIDT
jgi:hypothetical protein